MLHGTTMTEKIPGCVWTNEAVTLLLSLYLREKQKDRPVKLKKKEIWKYICAELWARGLLCSWQECDKKYRNLKQTFVRNLKQAGKKECRWIFFPIMFEINKHEPFVNEMVTTAFGHSSSNTSTSDYEDDDCSDDNNGCLPTEDDSVQYVPKPITTNHQTNLEISLLNQVHANQFFSRPMINLPKSPSPAPPSLQITSTQSSPLSLTYGSSVTPSPANGIDCHQFLDLTATNNKHTNDSPKPPNKKLRIEMNENTVNDQQQQQPPEWFKSFMVEYNKNEEKKMQTIKDLFDEVRRTNDIEYQRNVIMNDKNELLKNLLDFMNTNPK